MKIGIIGGGQLGRMLALAGYPLGFRFEFLDPNPDACAGHLAPLTVANYDDQSALLALAKKVDLVSFEFENVPVEAIDFLSMHLPVYPDSQILTVAQDRLFEKQAFTALNIPVPGYHPVNSLDELRQALAQTGFPAVLKTRRLGYDGKGQMLIENPAMIEAAWDQLGSAALILESFVRFKREVSLVAARGRGGETVCYPLSENRHRDGILRLSLATDNDPSQRFAEDYTRRIMERYNFVGVMAFEFFETDNGLLANEIAPRVHNSGHWTIEGASASQFENHLRAIAGLPLAPARLRGSAAMVNFIGKMPNNKSLLAIEGLRLHDYGKSPAPGRKLGHAGFCSLNPESRDAALARLAELMRSSTGEWF